MNWIKAAAILGAVCGMSGRSEAGSISLSLDLNGVVIFTSTSTSPDQSVMPDVSAANIALSGYGSAYQFTSLSANSDYTGTGPGSFLEVLGTLNTSGAGTTAAVLSIDVTQSGFLSPVGSPMSIVSSAYGSYSGAAGSMSYTSDYQGANSPTLVFPASGMNTYSSATGAIPIGTVPSDYELSSHYLISLNKTPSTTLSLEGEVTLGTPLSVPEPSSLALWGIAGIVGLIVTRSGRKHVAA